MNPIRIGLIRHFEVKYPLPSGRVTAQALTVWRNEYDRADVIRRKIDLGGVAWQRCYSSDLTRAVVTAEAAYSGEILKLPHLREPTIAEFQTGSLRLPVSWWRWVLRFAWLSSHRSQAAAKTEFLERVRYVRETVLREVREDTLIVGHAGMMAFLRKELLALGYTGPAFQTAENAKLYIFERRVGRSRR